jgi:catechol 2,3-dioxygenase-like lactoylglutathione lyase family enzyme
MRRLLFFVAGILAGLAIRAATAQSANRGIVGLNHVGISVPNLDQAVAYYTKTMGFPEAFRNLDDQGRANPGLCADQPKYVQISQNTFLELQPASAGQALGISHFGVVVEKMGAATAVFKGRGANVSEAR